MNIDEANAVPIMQLLERINIKPVSIRRHEARYFSPIRAQEKTPSFDVNVKKNAWYDHGIGEGGGCVKLVCNLLKFQKQDHELPDALRWIENMSGHISLIASPISDEPETEVDRTLILSSVKSIRERTLITYLESRGISFALGKKYLKEVCLYNRKSKKHFYALGLKNEDDGYELRNEFFKGWIDSKDISVIRGKKLNPEGFHVFEGTFDFLSALTYADTDQFDEDAYILHSANLVNRINPYIKNYGYRVAYTWLHDDAAGERATQTLSAFFKTEYGLVHRQMNHVFDGFKDMNLWHVAQRKNLPRNIS